MRHGSSMRKKGFVARLGRPTPLGMSLLFVAPIVAAAIFYVWAEITSVRLGYALSQAGDAHRILLEENRGLRIEVAALRAPERLRRLAEERFRLEPPRTEQVVRLDGKSTRDPRGGDANQLAGHARALSLAAAGEARR